MSPSLLAIAEALFTTEEGPPPSSRLAWLSDELDDQLARMGGKARVLLLLSLFAVVVLAPLLARTLRPLPAMTVHDRVHALEALERSRFSLPLLAVKAMLCIAYYEHPDSAREIGFDGACMLEVPR